MKYLETFVERFNEPGLKCAVAIENGIPYLTLYKEVSTAPSLMSFDEALKLAAKVQYSMQCPVHFHSLNSDAISFFVFDESRSYPAEIKAEYGTPVQEWLQGVLGGAPQERFNLRGDVVGADELPTKAQGYGFSWARRIGFESTSRSGKWCIVCSEQTVDALWEKLAKDISAGKFPAVLASSPAQAKSFGNTYLVAVFNEDWTDLTEVRRIREILREHGVTEELGYKRDMDTCNNVYHSPQEWTFRG